MKVEVRNGNVEQALRVFKRKVQKEGIIKTLKQNEYYEKPSAKRARKKKEGIKTVQCSGTRSNGEPCKLTTETKKETWKKNKKLNHLFNWDKKKPEKPKRYHQ